MAWGHFTRKQRLIATIVVSFCFFIAELVGQSDASRLVRTSADTSPAGVYTNSLALVADAFHYLSDLIGFAVALVALVVSERPQPPPKEYTFGWQRATLLGAFFNGVFLLALGVTIFVQAIERFANISPMEKPMVVLVVGCVGFVLNVLVMSFLHGASTGQDLRIDLVADKDEEHEGEHGPGHRRGREDASDCTEEAAISMSDRKPRVQIVRHKAPPSKQRTLMAVKSHCEHKHGAVVPPKAGRDLGMLGVLVHVLGDAVNNVGVIVAAVIVWNVEGDGRFYVDPTMGVFIAMTILLTAIPLTKRSGAILMETAPSDIDLRDVRHDLESIPGVDSVHELHVWRLSQHKSMATAHVVLEEGHVQSFADKATIMMECLHAYGIHSATLQPEGLPASEDARRRCAHGHTWASSSRHGYEAQGSEIPVPAHMRRVRPDCALGCGTTCGEMRCCPPRIEAVEHLSDR
ncbi:hypothetical protein RJ55_06621 [Drechmeria coniospora]|nr:hypothetical protein RJ55_06621 [Drechmeria coniospora]